MADEMGPVLQRIILEILKRVITSDLIKGKEQEAVNYLRGLAAANPGKIDDWAVDMLAVALGVA